MHNGADAPRGCLPIAWQLASSICVRFTPPPLPPHMQQVEVEEETYHKYMFHMHSFQLLYRAEVLEAFPNLATVVVNLEQQDVSPPPRRAQVMRLVNPFSNQDIHPPPPCIASHSQHTAPNRSISPSRLTTSLMVPRRLYPNPPMRAGWVLSSRVDPSRIRFHGAPCTEATLSPWIRLHPRAVK